MKNQIDPKKIMMGAAIGGAVGCVAMCLFANNKSKSGLSKGKSFLSQLTSSISDNISEQTSNMSDKAKDILDSVKDEIGEFPDMDNKDFRKGLIAGGVIGGLLGSGTTYFCNNPDSMCASWDWKGMAKNVLEFIEDHSGADVVKHAKNAKSDVLDLAVAGIQMWKNLKK